MTRTVDEEPVIIDDSRKYKQPMELIIGKKFKFEPWEECLKTMTNNEISSFTVDKTVSIIFVNVVYTFACSQINIKSLVLFQWLHTLTVFQFDTIPYTRAY